ncbi:MAG: hypothetical protein Q7S96_04785 [bacterium]|nr:hypothetical protein [bacterium]
MRNVTKERCVHAVLTQLAPYFDAERATVATLGGDGVECRVWSRLGIPIGHCWFIERDRRKQRALLRMERGAHHYCGDLDGFPAIFRAAVPETGLDVFHWDICQTMESHIQDLHAVLPLIMASTSRVLLITSADQRVHRVHRTREHLHAWWEMLLGATEAARFIAHLTASYAEVRTRGWSEGDEELAAMRELSVYLHILLVSCDAQRGLDALARSHDPSTARHAFPDGNIPKVTFLPDVLVRYVYYSRHHETHPGFRMRTLGMRLGQPEEPLVLTDAAAALAQLVMATPLSMIVSGKRGRLQQVTVRGNPDDEKKEEEEVMSAVADEFPTSREQKRTLDDQQVREWLVARAQRLILGSDARTAEGIETVAGNVLNELARFDQLESAVQQAGLLLEQAEASAAQLIKTALNGGAPAPHGSVEIAALAPQQPSDAPLAIGGIRNLTKVSRQKAEDRLTVMAAKGEKQLKDEYEALKAEFGVAVRPASRKFLRACYSNAKRTAAHGKVPDGTPPPQGGRVKATKPTSDLTPEQMDEVRMDCVFALAESSSAYEARRAAWAAQHGCSERYIDILLRRTRGKKFAEEFVVRCCARVSHQNHRQQLARRLIAAYAKHAPPIAFSEDTVLTDAKRKHQQLLASEKAARKQSGNGAKREAVAPPKAPAAAQSALLVWEDRCAIQLAMLAAHATRDNEQIKKARRDLAAKYETEEANVRLVEGVALGERAIEEAVDMLRTTPKHLRPQLARSLVALHKEIGTEHFPQKSARLLNRLQ